MRIDSTTDIYNIDLTALLRPGRGTGLICTTVDHDGRTVDEFCEALRSAAVGMENPYIDIECDTPAEDDFPSPRVQVCGRRPLTQPEDAAIRSQAVERNLYA